MTAIITPEQMEKRRTQLEQKDVERLFKMYNKYYRASKYFEAYKIAGILSSKYQIEGDRSFAIGSKDFEG